MASKSCDKVQNFENSVLTLQRGLNTSNLLNQAIFFSLLDEEAVSADGETFTWNDIKEINEFWDWTSTVLVKQLYTNESDFSEEEFTLNGQNRLVGGLRFGQTRGKPNTGSRCYNTHFNKIGPRCLSNSKDKNDISCPYQNESRSECVRASELDAFRY